MPVRSWILAHLFLSHLAVAAPIDDAEHLLQTNRPGAALLLLQEHVGAHPEDVEAQELLIDIQLNAGLIDSVLRTHQDRTRQHPADPDAWYLLGRAALDVTEAAAAYQKALEIDPDHARSLTGQAAMLRATGQPTQAIPLYTRALMVDASLLEAWTGLWTCQLMQDDHRSAALTAERASEVVPDAAEPWLTLALLRPDQARQYLASGLQHNPGEYRLTVDYARQLFQERDLSGAQQAYTSALPIAADDPTVRTESAMLVELADGRLDWDGAHLLMDVRTQANTPETLRRVDGVVGQHPRSCLARVIRGNIHQIQGTTDQAEADFRAALSVSPNSPEANSALGLLLLSQRRPAEAIAPLQVARRLRADDVALGLALSVALIEGQDPGAGGMLLLELIEQFPVHPGPPLALAQMLVKLGEPERAYQILLEASQRMPEPQVVLALAATAQAAGRMEEAASAMRDLGARTGDPRFEQAARQLFAAPQE